MLYMLLGEDAPGSLEKRLSVRPLHVARLEQLKAEGRLLLAGPFPAVDALDPGAAGFSGSLIVAEFPSLVAAQAWLAEDVYVREGVYARTDVRPFKQVFP